MAQAEGLEVRVNSIATDAASAKAEAAARAALGDDTFVSHRDAVNASLARVEVDGERVGPPLVWVVFAADVPGPSLGAGESAGSTSTKAFVVLDPDSFEILSSE